MAGTIEIRRTAIDWRTHVSDGTVITGFVSEDEARGYAYGRYPGYTIRLSGVEVKAPGGLVEKAPPIAPLTVRDQFAMAALTGMLSDSSVRDTPSGLAEAAYRVADGMLEARKVPT